MGLLPFPERLAQNVVKSHLETSQYTNEELKRLVWTVYSQEEIRNMQSKVGVECLCPGKLHFPVLICLEWGMKFSLCLVSVAFFVFLFLINVFSKTKVLI